MRGGTAVVEGWQASQIWELSTRGRRLGEAVDSSRGEMPTVEVGLGSYRSCAARGRAGVQPTPAGVMPDGSRGKV
ncbi:hypothetical protein C8Q77DRAFT_806549 [Trametes polyzona]|nr:hypothetical protein C8Q77DRAFT_806549 [Trametes polyzona]